MRFFDRRLKSKDFVICWLVGKVTKRLYGVRIAQCSARVVRIYLCAANQKLYSSLGLLIWSEGYHLIAQLKMCSYPSSIPRRYPKFLSQRSEAHREGNSAEAGG